MKQTDDQIAAELEELKAERATLAAKKTPEDAREDADLYLTDIRAVTQTRPVGLALNRDIRGEALLEIVVAFVASRDDFGEWLREELTTVASEVTRKQKSQQLAKLDAKISEAQAEHNTRRIDAAKAEAEQRILAEIA
jgi:LPS O-antigen subunit length determinant protein (WzzB/FepE family)